MTVIEERLGEPQGRFEGAVLKRHVNLTVAPTERHFWSPHLSIDVLAEGEGTTLRGRYAPHPSIWTGIMAAYGVLIMAAIAGAVYGTSQWILGWTPWALWALPVSAVVAAAIYASAGVGQKLAEDQMHDLHDFFDDCVQRASDPPPPNGAETGRA